MSNKTNSSLSVAPEVLQGLGFDLVREREGISQFSLKANGLKVLLVPNHTSQVATVMLVYHVGSRNEAVGYTGSTHFLEHMMFKGSKNFGNYAEVLTPLGGDYNATTSYDRTNYFAKVPKQHLRLVLALEADRMRNLKLRKEDRDSEMTVVRNEFENGKNSPFSVLIEEVGAAAFRAHPYHHPIIGWLSDVENVPLERMQAFYDQFYWPNNATLMITGNFDPAEALAMVAEEFGKIPTSPHAIPSMYTVEPAQEGERRVNLERISTEPPMVLVGHRVPGAAHEDSPALAVIADLLGSSSRKASRLYRALVASGMAVEAFAESNGQMDEFLFYMGAFVNPQGEQEAAAVEAALLAQCEKLKDELVSDDELKRVKKAHRKSALLSTDNQMAFLSALCEAEATGNWENFLDNRNKYEAVTAEQVREVARRYFQRKNRTVGVFAPLSDDRKGSEAEAAAVPAAQPVDSAAAAEADASAFSYEAATVTRVFDNGMTVQVLPMEGATTVGVALRMTAGDHYAPAGKPLVPTLTAMMLNRGAKHATALEMAEMLEEMGASIGFDTDKFALKSAGKVVADDLGVYIALLGDCVRNPLFPAAEFEQVKAMVHAHVAQSLSDTDTLSAVALSQKLFPEGSPYYEESLDKVLAGLDAITLEDLKAFHGAVYTPKSVVMTITGNTTPEAAFKPVELALGSWQGGEAPSIAVPAVAAVEAEKVVVHVPEMTSVAIKIGRVLPTRIGTDDYFVAKMANDALGENTLSARLGLAVRVKHGLTYGISSHFDGAAWGNGAWLIGLTVNPKNVDRALGVVNDVLNQFVAEGVTAEELAKWVENMVGGFQVSLDNPLAVARTMNNYTFIGLGPKYMDILPAGFRAVTVEAVNAYIKANFDPSKLVTVVVGTV